MSEIENTENKTPAAPTSVGPLPSSKKTHTPKTPLQMKVVNLVVVAFFAYAGYNYFTGNTSSQKMEAATPAVVPTPVSVAAHPADPRMDRFYVQESFNSLKSLFPMTRSSVPTAIVKAGDGRAAFCGQTVTYRLREGVNGTGSAGKTQTMILGQAHDQQALTWGMEGMRVGEIREIKLPKQAASTPHALRDASEFNNVYVEMLGLTPEMPVAGKMPLRRFMVRGEAGYDLRCGDASVFHLTLRSGTGEIIFTSLGATPLYIELGQGKGLPFGLELGLHEMGPAGEYTLIIPPELQQPLYPAGKVPQPPEALEVQAFPALTLPKNQLLIADIQVLAQPPMKAAPVAAPVATP